MHVTESTPRPDFRRREGILRTIQPGEYAFRAIVGVAAALVFLIIIAMLYELTKQAWPAIHKFGIGFLWSDEWNPPKQRFGALPFIAGTLITSQRALAFGVVIGVGAALFLVEIAPGWIRVPVSYTFELVFASPSLVYGRICVF